MTEQVLNATEFAAVLALNAEYRQAFFLNKCKEQGLFYILVQEEGPYLLEDAEDTADALAQSEDDTPSRAQVLPVWSHRQLAEHYCRSLGLEHTTVQSVTLEVWHTQWSPLLKENKVLLGFMPLDEHSEFATDEPELL